VLDGNRRLDPLFEEITEKLCHINRVCFLNLIESQEMKDDSFSINNTKEAELCLEVLYRIKALVGNDKRGLELLKKKIGIITPYRGQVNLLHQLWRQNFKHFGFNLNDLKIDTVDSFQGQECEIVIFSCVRNNPQNILGFLNDHRRLNVALTRAKNFLFVIGSRHCLERGHKLWRDLIQHCDQDDKKMGVYDFYQPDGVRGLWDPQGNTGI